MEVPQKSPDIIAPAVETYHGSISEPQDREQTARDALPHRGVQDKPHQLNTEVSQRSLRCVASTEQVYCCSISHSRDREQVFRDALAAGNIAALNDGAPRLCQSTAEHQDETNYFKSAQWTPDGTSILTSSADNTIRTFIVPPTLLDSSSSTINLLPYTTHLHPTPVNSLIPYPYYDLSDPSTALYISAPNDLPIRLTNALSPTPTPLSTYKLICPTTEAYLTPSSLVWSTNSHFMTGTDCLIALFDVSRNGEGPVTRLPTIPSKRHKMKGGGVGMRGIVSALSHQPPSGNGEEGMLAAGTWTRWVGLYDMGGMGGTVATWSIAGAADEMAGIGGKGVSQTAWSACGKYLFVAERGSSGILVYDVRVTGKLVAWLTGREADTTQRLSVDVFGADTGPEVWAGGVDGIVRVWEGVGSIEGAQERSWEWRAHDDPVSSTIIHNSGTVVATCSGQKSFVDRQGSQDVSDSDESGSNDESEDASESSENESIFSNSSSSSQSSSGAADNSLKIWSL